MTPQQPEFVSLARSVEEIRTALLGNAMEGRKGIIHFHDKMAEDLYGVGSDGEPIEGKSNTLMSRMSNMEDRQKKAWWVFSGIVLAITAAKVGISAIIDKIFGKS